MMSSYKPQTDKNEIAQASTRVNNSGHSPQSNLYTQEGNQRAIAESETWYLARYLVGSMFDKPDSKPSLESLGFTVSDADGVFYEVVPPPGWTKSTDGLWTTVKDDNGKVRIEQFYKGAWYDERAFLRVTTA